MATNSRSFFNLLYLVIGKNPEDVNIHRLIKNHQVIFPAILGVENTFATFPVFRNIWCYSQQCGNIIFRVSSCLSRKFSQFVCNFVHSVLFTFQVRALCETLVVHNSMKTRGHFSLYGTLSIGHALHPGIQRVQPWPFKDLTYNGSNKQDFVSFRPPGIEEGSVVWQSPSFVQCLSAHRWQFNIWRFSMRICVCFGDYGSGTTGCWPLRGTTQARLAPSLRAASWARTWGNAPVLAK